MQFTQNYSTKPNHGMIPLNVVYMTVIPLYGYVFQLLASLKMGIMFDLQHTHLGIDKSSQVPGNGDPTLGAPLNTRAFSIAPKRTNQRHNLHRVLKGQAGRV